MRKILIPFLLFTLSAHAPAMVQPYEHAAGIRAGYSSGINYKGFFLYSMNAVGIDVLYNPHGLHVAAQFLVHFEPFQNRRWLLYAGGGPFSGKWDEEFSLGLVTTGGIEYTLRKQPLNFGFDWRPMLSLYRIQDYDLFDFGLTIRYRFGL